VNCLASATRALPGFGRMGFRGSRVQIPPPLALLAALPVKSRRPDSSTDGRGFASTLRPFSLSLRCYAIATDQLPT